jgi:uncharacterized protein YgiM (DUF1202 family)
MKKTIAVLVAVGFLVSTSSFAMAGYGRHGGGSYGYKGYHGSNYGYRGHHRSYYRHANHYGHRGGYHRSYHRGYGGHFWGFLGFGLLTGALLTTVLFPPPPPAVVYQAPPPTVVYQQLPPVVVERYYYGAPAPSKVLEHVWVEVLRLNIRSGPGSSHDVINSARQGEMLYVEGRDANWLYVRTIEGRHGWVMKQYTSTQATPVG